MTVSDPGVLRALDGLIEPDVRGDPEPPLRWVCTSTRTLVALLAQQQHRLSHVTVAELLHAQGYSLQSNRKTADERGVVEAALMSLGLGLRSRGPA